MKLSRVRLTALSSVALASTIALSGCGLLPNFGQQPNGQGQQTEAPVQPTAPPPTQGGDTAQGGETAAPPVTTPTDAGAPAGSSTRVNIGTELRDPDTGDVVTIVSAIRHNPTENYSYSQDPNGDLVYLEVKVVPGQTYSGVISGYDFRLGPESAGVAFGALDELENAGYTYFDSAARRDGEHSGYIPIYVKDGSGPISGTYVRSEAEVIGENKTVPEYSATFQIPQG